MGGDAFNVCLQELGSDDDFTDFQLWNLRTGPFAVPGYGYPDAADFPETWTDGTLLSSGDLTSEPRAAQAWPLTRRAQMMQVSSDSEPIILVDRKNLSIHWEIDPGDTLSIPVDSDTWLLLADPWLNAITTGVNLVSLGEVREEQITLVQLYPVPLRPGRALTIQYYLPQEAIYSGAHPLRLYNVLGQQIDELSVPWIEGVHQLEWTLPVLAGGRYFVCVDGSALPLILLP